MRFQHWTPLWVARVHPFSHHNIQDKRRPVIKLTKLLYSCFRDKAKEDSFEVGFARCLTRSGSGLTKEAEKRIRWTDKTMNFLLFRKIYYIANNLSVWLSNHQRNGCCKTKAWLATKGWGYFWVHDLHLYLFDV